MKGCPTGRVHISTIVLLAAALLAAVSIGLSLSRSRESKPKIETADGVAGVSGDRLAELERKVAENPGDSMAWHAQGEEQFNRGLFGDAIVSLDKATKIAPTNAILWSALGEARVMASTSNPMPPEALADFRRAQAADPSDPRSRYFLAVKQDLDGDHKGAVAAWLALLKATPADAPWRGDLVRTIEQVGRINNIDVAGRIADAGGAATPPPARASLPGPTPQDLQAAASIPAREQREMAQAMVARLEARLKAEPGNPDGWIMLIRSRAYLGETDKASAALRDAVAANPGEADALRQQAAALGVR